MEDGILKNGYPITHFKSGDVITRLHPSRTKRRVYSDYGNGSHEELFEDGSYIGDPMKFIGIFNNQIWLEHMGSFHKGSVSRLDLSDWGENWGLFEMPEGYNYSSI